MDEEEHVAVTSSDQRDRGRRISTKRLPSHLTEPSHTHNEPLPLSHPLRELMQLVLISEAFVLINVDCGPKGGGGLVEVSFSLWASSDLVPPLPPSNILPLLSWVKLTLKCTL